MKKWYFRTIRTYVAAVLDYFKGLETQTTDQAGNTLTKTVPFMYVSKEKSAMFEMVSNTQHRTGNVNIIPRGTISLISIQKDDTRQTNRNTKTNRVKKDDTIQYSYNSVSYTFIFEVKIICRGMNEATMLVEEIAPRFNPNCSLAVYDVDNLDEPTRLPFRLLDISIEEFEPMDETSMNLFIVDCTCQLEGQLYAPIENAKAIDKIKVNLYKEDKRVAGFDENTGFFEEVLNEVKIEGFDKNTLVKGVNTITLAYNVTHVDDLEFNWVIDQGDAVIREQSRNIVTISATGKFIDISCHITGKDIDQTYSRTFVVDA